MRRIVMFNRISADGYFSTLDGKLDWTVPDADIDKEAMSGEAQFDTVLFGHRTYQMFESFWPHALGDPAAPDPHHAGRRTPEIKAMAVMLNESKKLVFSRSRTQVAWNNSHLVRELDPREIEVMKRQPGKDMIVFGSGTIVAQLTEHRLIDEYHLIVSPIALGAGKPLFAGMPRPVRLELLEARPYASGNVVVRYAPRGAAVE